ncbi:MAG: hypothetical protein LJE89_07535 [Deltaproteobacteria bacterium]|nr:hypothetical protein [Deltaproteobacteria bacterium]
MVHFPNIMILPDKVYSLSIQKAESKRALDRFLFDYTAHGVSFTDPYDKWRTLLGVSKEFWEDYPFYKLGVPLEWLLLRFLHHHLTAKSLDLLSGDNGQVLNSSNYRTLLGREMTEAEGEESLRVLLKSWAEVHPKGVIEFKDIYVSSHFTAQALRQIIETLKSKGHLKDLGQNVYLVEKKMLDAS